MAGHSKWANIQHRKGRQDAARSKLFSKLAKEITVAAKMGDPDPDKNPRLRLAVKEAKGQSVPKDVIERAIKKSQGGDAENYDEIRYEGYGPGGVAVIVEAMTDNRNRTASSVRSTSLRTAVSVNVSTSPPEASAGTSMSGVWVSSPVALASGPPVCAQEKLSARISESSGTRGPAITRIGSSGTSISGPGTQTSCTHCSVPMQFPSKQTHVSWPGMQSVGPVVVGSVVGAVPPVSALDVLPEPSVSSSSPPLSSHPAKQSVAARRKPIR